MRSSAVVRPSICVIAARQCPLNLLGAYHKWSIQAAAGLVLLLSGALFLPRAFAPPTFEEVDAKARAEEAAAKERARAADAARVAKEVALAQAGNAALEAERQRAEAVKKKQEADLHALRSRAFMASPAERQQMLKEACAAGCSPGEADAIVGAVADPAERARLEALVKRLDADHAVKAAKVRQEAREQFASGLDRALLEKRLNPDDVSAVGRDKTTLRIKAWFCSRQYVYDFKHKGDGELARAVGFRRVECENAVDVY